MANQGVALQTKEEINVEERLHKLSIIMKKAENGDPQAIALLEQINALTK
ncbi:hypothetical protein KHU47_27760 [Bacillus cereus]|nr:hypothetical protein [Bacillus cereus]MBT0793170.1 hypothetical protein [Bacillus cereus]